MTHPNREELAGRLEKAAADPFGHFAGEAKDTLALAYVSDLKEAAAALRQSPSVKEVAQIIREHALSRSGEPCTPRESVTAAQAIAALYGGEGG